MPTDAARGERPTLDNSACGVSGKVPGIPYHSKMATRRTAYRPSGRQSIEKVAQEVIVRDQRFGRLPCSGLEDQRPDALLGLRCTDCGSGAELIRVPQRDVAHAGVPDVHLTHAVYMAVQP